MHTLSLISKSIAVSFLSFFAILSVEAQTRSNAIPNAAADLNTKGEEVSTRISILPKAGANAIQLHITNEMASDITIQVIDQAGKTIKKEATFFQKGKVQYLLEGILDLPSGTYYIDMHNSKTGKTYKAVFINF